MSNPYRENDYAVSIITKPAFWIRYGLHLAVCFFVAGGLGAGAYSMHWKMTHTTPRPTTCVEEVKANNDWDSTCSPGAHIERMGDYYFTCRCPTEKNGQAQ